MWAAAARALRRLAGETGDPVDDRRDDRELDQGPGDGRPLVEQVLRRLALGEAQRVAQRRERRRRTCSRERVGLSLDRGDRRGNRACAHRRIPAARGRFRSASPSPTCSARAGLDTELWRVRCRSPAGAGFSRGVDDDREVAREPASRGADAGSGPSSRRRRVRGRDCVAARVHRRLPGSTSK